LACEYCCNSCSSSFVPFEDSWLVADLFILRIPGWSLDWKTNY
jgi:hypothetical protein